MKLFRKDKEETAVNIQAEKLAGIIIQIQQQLAAFLNKKVQKLSPEMIKTLLISFSAAFGAYYLYLIFQAFN